MYNMELEPKVRDEKSHKIPNSSSDIAMKPCRSGEDYAKLLAALAHQCGKPLQELEILVFRAEVQSGLRLNSKARKHVRRAAYDSFRDVMSKLKGKLLKFCGLLEHGAMSKVSRAGKALLATSTGMENLDFTTIPSIARFGAMAFVCRLLSDPFAEPVRRLKITLGTHEALPMAALLNQCGADLVHLDYSTTNMRYVTTQYPPSVGPSLNLADDDDEEEISHASYLEDMFDTGTTSTFYDISPDDQDEFGAEINIPRLCPNLHELHGMRVHCTTGPTKISEMKSLTHLELNVCNDSAVFNEIAHQISKLRSLTYLRLCGYSDIDGIFAIKSSSLRVLGCEKVPKHPTIFIDPLCTKLRVITLYDTVRGNGFDFQSHPVTYGSGWLGQNRYPAFLVNSTVQIPSECVVLFGSSVYIAGERYTLSDGLTHTAQSCPPWFKNYYDSFKMDMDDHHGQRMFENVGQLVNTE